MKVLLAVDPGLSDPAGARFHDGVLVNASRVDVPAKFARLDRANRAAAIGRLIVDWAGREVFSRAGTSDLELAFEWPQVYPPGKDKGGDPNKSLLPLLAVGAWLAGRLDCRAAGFLPSEWTGQVPKSTTGDPWSSPRGKRVWGILSPRERVCVVASHDAIDAVGIGLKHLGRYERVRNLPGTT